MYTPKCWECCILSKFHTFKRSLKLIPKIVSNLKSEEIRYVPCKSTPSQRFKKTALLIHWRDATVLHASSAACYAYSVYMCARTTRRTIVRYKHKHRMHVLCHINCRLGLIKRKGLPWIPVMISALHFFLIKTLKSSKNSFMRHYWPNLVTSLLSFMFYEYFLSNPFCLLVLY